MIENMIKTDKIFLTSKEVAKFLNISTGTLAVWRCEKRYNIPFIKVGRSVKYPVKGINEWLNSQVHC